MTRKRMTPGARTLASVGLSQTEVAEAAGLSQSAVSAVLRGDRTRAGSDAREAVLSAVRKLAGASAGGRVAEAVDRAEQAQDGSR
jgi:predicted transcriptional regulator